MKKALMAVYLTGFSILSVYSQTEFRIKGHDKNFFIEHKVVAKENFYSIGRKYNVNAKQIANYNSLDMKKGLSIGKLLRIPLTDSNFNQHAEGGIPIIYIAGENENLPAISAANNQVSQENLRQWNHLTDDNITTGQKLVVGYLVPGPGKTNQAVVAQKTTEKQEQKTELIKDTAILSTQKIEKPVSKYPLAIDSSKFMAGQEKVSDQNQAEKKQTTGQLNEVKTVEVSDQGYFKWAFQQQAKKSAPKKTMTVTSGIFRTSNGWNDKKFYLMIDDVEPGTIIKITNPSNNKIVYAKVLSEMKGAAHSPGLDIRISNAAAAILEIDDTEKFILKLNY